MGIETNPTREADDPRVYFAAERTLLAWIRTGLTVIGLGFVVARFGLFLRVIRGDAGSEDGTHYGSTLIGVGLVLLGSTAIAVAARKHQRFCARLDSSGGRSTPAMSWPLWFAATLAAVGVVLAAYILMRSNG